MRLIWPPMIYAPCHIPLARPDAAKAACIPHRTALQGVDCIAAWFGYGGDEVHLGATPMFHIVGMQGIMNVAISTAAIPLSSCPVGTAKPPQA